MKKTTASLHFKPIMVNLMYVASIILFTLFVYFAQADGVRYYSPMDTSAVWTAVIKRAIQFMVPGAGILVLATIWNNRDQGESK